MNKSSQDDVKEIFRRFLVVEELWEDFFENNEGERDNFLNYIDCKIRDLKKDLVWLKRTRK